MPAQLTTTVLTIAVVCALNGWELASAIAGAIAVLWQLAVMFVDSTPLPPAT